MDIDTLANLIISLPVIGIVLVIIFYFVPTIIAKARNHANSGTIFLLNLLFGWTGILWFALVLWAIIGNKYQLNAEKETFRTTKDGVKIPINKLS